MPMGTFLKCSQRKATTCLRSCYWLSLFNAQQNLLTCHTKPAKMLRSMTGYGRAEGIVRSQPCTVELRSVNGRFLELNCRMPKAWADKEQLLRELLRERIGRGSISLTVRLEDAAATSTVALNVDLAKNLVERLRSLRNELGLSGDVSIHDILLIPSILQGAPDNEGTDDVWPEVSHLVNAAIDSLTEMRDKEGAELQRDFDSRLSGLEQAIDVVATMSSGRIPVERERLRERVAQLMSDGVDEQRLQLEIVLLAEKLDVSEEVTRLQSHIKFFRENMNTTKSAGRKLNFLLQEMNREVNTIGSKCNDAEIARIVVGMKEEMERMREQIQNVE